jgi:hypothetical protein
MNDLAVIVENAVEDDQHMIHIVVTEKIKNNLQNTKKMNCILHIENIRFYLYFPSYLVLLLLMVAV